MTLEDPMHLLIEKTRGGDLNAFDTLVRISKPRLLDYIRSRMGEYVRTQFSEEDVLQETFVSVANSLNKFKWQGEASFYAWLSRIAEHLIRNISRKKPVGQLNLSRDLTASITSPSKALRRNARFDRLEKAVESLEDDQREALLLARIEGLKVKEIARKMNRTPDSVKKLLGRALIQVRRLFGDTETLGLPNRTFKTNGKAEEND